MSVLCIETSGELCSLLLSREGESPLYVERPLSRGHDQVLFPLLTELLEEGSMGASDIEAVVVGCGPGSFTGIRLGMAAAIGLSFGRDCPLWGVSSFEAMVYARPQEILAAPQLLTLSPAQQQVYFQRFDRQRRPLGDPGLMDLEGDWGDRTSQEVWVSHSSLEGPGNILVRPTAMGVYGAYCHGVARPHPEPLYIKAPYA